MSPDLLSVSNLRIFYNKAICAVSDASLRVSPGQIVCLLGSNGAGKSTVLKALSGILEREGGEVVDGEARILGQAIESLSADAIVSLGVAHVPEGRGLFSQLTVEENLHMGGFTQPRDALSNSLDQVFSLFPRLAERRRQTSGYLSGGEQQMVAVARALMSRPRLLILDEPSLGLAPQVIDVIFNALLRLNRELGLGVLLVEQNARLALEVSNYGYIMENGRVVLEGAPDVLSADSDIKEFYLGFSSAGNRKSMRDVKHYKRRKRWLP